MFKFFQFFFLIIEPTITPLSRLSLIRVRLAGHGRILSLFSIVPIQSSPLIYFSNPRDSIHNSHIEELESNRFTLEPNPICSLYISPLQLSNSLRGD